MALGRRLEFARKLRGMTQDEVAREAGLDPDSGRATVQAIESRDSNRSKYAGQLARALRVRLDWLQDGTEPMELTGQDATAQSQMVPLIGTKVPVIEFPTIPDVLADRNTSPATMAVDWIYPPMKDHGTRTFAFKQPDDSMASAGPRSYPVGCYIYVDPDQTQATHDRPVLAKLATGSVLVGHYMSQGGRTWLRMLNAAYPAVSESFEVVGLVIWVGQEV